VRLRSLTAADIPAVMQLKDAAGWNQTAADWLRFLHANPSGCFAADEDGNLVGTATSIIYERRVAWIGMLIVHQRWRGRGIGSALLERTMRYLDACGVPCMKLDATPQGRPLYEKFGFTVEYDIERHRLVRTPRPSRDLVTAPPLDHVVRLDRDVFGVDRATLLRSLAHDAPELVQVDADDSGVAGYTFGRRGSLADQLGPWVSTSAAGAERLLDGFLSRSTAARVFVDCVRPNPWALPLVRARGFEHSRRLTRMYCGANDHPGRPEHQGGTLGPEFG